MTTKANKRERLLAAKKQGSKAVQVTATIIIPGDNSVGIPDYTIKLDFGSWAGGYERFFAAHSISRDDHREGLKDWADTYHADNENAHVLYGDECYDCGRIGCVGGCTYDV